MLPACWCGRRIDFIGLAAISLYEDFCHNYSDKAHIYKCFFFLKIMDNINHIKISKGMKAADLIRGMKNMGYNAGKLADAVDILDEMIQDKDCRVFFGQAGAMVPGGLRLVLREFLERKWVDVFVCTGASLTHDLVEGLGFPHLKLEGGADDGKLRKQGYDRVYNSLMQNKAYPALEDFFNKHWVVFEKAKNIREFLTLLGSVSPRDTLLRAAYEKKIPVFCPALADSGIGLMIWGRKAAGKKINIDAFGDMQEIIDIAWMAKKNGVFYVGGGVPKNFIQQSMQFGKPASFGVQVTTDRAEFGGSSGASLQEGISWGKMKVGGKFVDVSCDATIALPLILAGLKERL